MDSSSRLLKELREIENDKRSGVSVELVDGKLTHLMGTIRGASRLAFCPQTTFWVPLSNRADPLTRAGLVS